jgi:hypothetical protein
MRLLVALPPDSLSLHTLHTASHWQGSVMEVKAAPADLCPETLYREKAELYQMVGALASNRQSPKIN